jgi:hypothetical protein
MKRQKCRTKRKRPPAGDVEGKRHDSKLFVMAWTTFCFVAAFILGYSGRSGTSQFASAGSFLAACLLGADRISGSRIVSNLLKKLGKEGRD